MSVIGILLFISTGIYFSFNILCRASKQKDVLKLTQKTKFINSKRVSNKTYTKDSVTGNIRGNAKGNSKENEYSTIEVDGAIENQINTSTTDSPAKPTSSSGYDLAKPQIKTEEISKEYDHLEHLGINRRPDKGHDSSDTYEHAHVEGNENNDTYSHAQSGQYTYMDSCTSAHTGQVDNTYEQTRNVRYGDSNTYDHSRSSVNEAKTKFADYAYAHAKNSSMTEDDYDHAGSGDRNDIDTYE